MKRLKLIFCLLLSLPAVVGASPLETIPPPITDFFIPVHQRSVEPVRNPGDFIGQVFAQNPEDWQTRPEAAPITGVPVTIASGPRTRESVATNSNSDVLTAKADAERDADVEVKPYIWFGHGCSLSVFGTMTGIASVMATEHYFPNSNCLIPLMGMAGGYLLTTSVGIKTVYSYQPDPPAARFIGKSPEYIDIYISTYKSTRGHKQAEWVAGGCFVGTLMNGITLYTVIIPLLTGLVPD